MMTRSAPCHPPVMVSRSCRPVGMPLILPLMHGQQRQGPILAATPHASWMVLPLGLVVTFLLHLVHPHERRCQARGYKPFSSLLCYIGRTFEDQHTKHAGELIADDQKPYSSLAFSQPYLPKLLNTPTSPPSAISPLSLCMTTNGALPSRGTRSSSSAIRWYAIPAVVSVSSR